MDILGIGECMIQLDADGDLASATAFTRQVGGDVYNTLVAASRLGSRTGFLTQVADDAFGQVLLRHFEANGIDTRNVHTKANGFNGLYFTAYQPDGSHEFVYYRQNSAASQISPDLVDARTVAQTQIVYASGISQAISSGARRTVLKAFRLAREQRILVAYDPNFRPSLWRHKDDALDAMIEVLPYVDVILPSAEDMAKLFEFEAEKHLLEYFHLKGVSVVVLKKGQEGAVLSYKRKQAVIPPVSVAHVKDAVGAGDAFNGGFLHSLIRQKSLAACAELGVQVAAYSLREIGPIRGLPDAATLMPEKPAPGEDTLLEPKSAKVVGFEESLADAPRFAPFFTP